jgi:hypothetical protein
MSHADSGPPLQVSALTQFSCMWVRLGNAESFIHITAIESFTWKHFIFVSFLDLTVLEGCYEYCSVAGTRNLSLLMISGVTSSYVFSKCVICNFSYLIRLDGHLLSILQSYHTTDIRPNLLSPHWKIFKLEVMDFNEIYIFGKMSCFWEKWHSFTPASCKAGDEFDECE